MAIQDLTSSALWTRRVGLRSFSKTTGARRGVVLRHPPRHLFLAGDVPELRPPGAEIHHGRGERESRVSDGVQGPPTACPITLPARTRPVSRQLRCAVTLHPPPGWRPRSDRRRSFVFCTVRGRRATSGAGRSARPPTARRPAEPSTSSQSRLAAARSTYFASLPRPPFPLDPAAFRAIEKGAEPRRCSTPPSRRARSQQLMSYSAIGAVRLRRHQQTNKLAPSRSAPPGPLRRRYETAVRCGARGPTTLGGWCVNRMTMA